MVRNFKSLSVATVGCGRMGAFASKQNEELSPIFWQPISHLRALRSFDGLNIVGCCDTNKDQALAAANLYGVGKAYTDTAELLNENRIDLLTIATRTPNKAQIIRDAASVGVRAIHVEKPLCNSAHELVEIERIARERNLLMTYGCLRRYLGPYRRAKHQVSQSEFGDITNISVSLGRSTLLWTQIHAVDQLLMFAGGRKPLRVQAWLGDAEIETTNPQMVLNDPEVYSIVVMFEDGLIGQVTISSGHATKVSSSSSTLEIFANGWQAFRSSIPDGDIYQKKNEAAPLADNGETEYGGSAAPISFLLNALAGDQDALVFVENNQKAIFETQRIIFSALHSHLEGGKTVEFGTYPESISIMGISHGAPA